MDTQVANEQIKTIGPTGGGDDSFVGRHVGPDEQETAEMLSLVGVSSLEELVEQTVPANIRIKRGLRLPDPAGEAEAMAELAKIAAGNKVFTSLIGQGYYGTVTPPVIQRNILENPGWYTQYTPYQAEISQGRLEALLNFQTMVSDLTALPLANASMLDEATAAAEAMAMCRAIVMERQPADVTPVFFIDESCHPQTIAVCQTRAKAVGIEVVVGKAEERLEEGTEARRHEGTKGKLVGVLVQYPATDGRIIDWTPAIAAAHKAGALAAVATDLLALTLIKPPGEMGADIAVGSAQRFGVPMGFGGPHAAFMATKNEHARKMPGRLVGVSKDTTGKAAYRLALQTREQHIRREKATSNICTAQVLLAIMAGMYAVWHGPKGLKKIAGRVHGNALRLADALAAGGHTLLSDAFFDTLAVRPVGRSIEQVLAAAAAAKLNLRDMGQAIGISIDETTTEEDLAAIAQTFGSSFSPPPTTHNPQSEISNFKFEAPRSSPFLSHPVFNSYHSETEMLRYIKKLESRDLSLCQSMIPLGSCTMKLNAAAEMLPISWPAFAKLHPYAPADQAKGYAKMTKQLESWLAEITGFAAVSLQPNAGSQGELAGLLTIRGHHESRGQNQRTVCLIPTSAHGTNPASAAMVGYSVVAVECDQHGNVDVADLKKKAEEHKDKLAALMITYPSTHGVFEPDIKEICQIIHQNGGQVYMDGANMNAQVGLCRPGDIGADVCHLNLHKTFCIPHGGGGPGVGPIAVAKHLAKFLPGDPSISPNPLPNPPPEYRGRENNVGGAVAAANYGSASILPISWMYIRMMGSRGLKRATQTAILNANYMAKRLEGYYPVLYKGVSGRVAHEFIIDCRHFEKSAGIKVEDIAKRLMDYSFHAPTMSFPVPGTLMIEPTESESKAECDRLCDALIQIRQEIRDIEDGRADRTDNVLRNAPHPLSVLCADQWPHKYSREQAAYPAKNLRDYKFWPAVARIDNPWGDRNLMCACPPVGT